jgi:hypothetical protein
MMEYQVPQFIEVEDKIFGPLTLKQFIYIAGGTGLTVGLVLYLGTFGIILSLPVVALALALSFYKVNNKSFVEVLDAGFNYYIGGRLYLWKKDENPPAVTPVAPPPTITREKLGMSQGKLHALALSLDIQDQNAPEA